MRRVAAAVLVLAALAACPSTGGGTATEQGDSGSPPDAAEAGPDGAAADCGPQSIYDCKCFCGDDLRVVGYSPQFSACEQGGCRGDCTQICGDAGVADPAQDAPDAVDEPGQTPDAADAPDAADLPPDLADALPDPGPDCGPSQCIDCACTCPDGRKFPYGGCFDACNPAPDVVRNCSADCTGYCGATPTPCQGPGYPGSGTGTCANGDRCVQVPCPRCGVAPPSYCVPPACAIDGCWIDADCGEGLRCVGPDVMAGSQGQCLPATTPPACWADADCPDGATCRGPAHCPVCEACAMLEAAGRCVATVAAVVLWVDSTTSSPGDTIAPVWWNFGADPIYVAGCATYGVQRLDAAGWTDLGSPDPCSKEGPAVKIAAGGAFVDTASWTAPMTVDPATQPVTCRFAGAYRTGCQDGLPLSQAGCTGGPIQVLSREFTVAMVE